MAKKKTATPKPKAKATASKKVKAAKSDAPKPARTKVVASSYDVLSDDAGKRTKQVVSALHEASEKSMLTKKPRPTRCMLASNVKQSLLDYSCLEQQWIMCCRGAPRGGFRMVVGDEATGKSTLMFTDMAHAMLKYNARCLYIECEGKPLASDRMMQCMNSDPQKALKLLRNITMETAESTAQIFPKTEKWAKLQREGIKEKGKYVLEPLPAHIPLVVVWDPIGALMTKEQAAGHVIWDAAVEDSKKHEVGEGSNLTHAKFFWNLRRALPPFIRRYNMHVVAVFPAATGILMKQHEAKKYQQMSSWKETLMQMTWIGGKALRGLASSILCLTHDGSIINPTTKDIVRKVVKTMLRKNSYGPEGVLGVFHVDSELVPGGVTYLPPPIDFSPMLPDVLKRCNGLGFRMDDKSGLCRVEKFGWNGLPLRTVHSLLHNTEGAVEDIAKSIGIPGYADFISLTESGAMGGSSEVVSAADVNAALAEVGADMQVDEDELQAEGVEDEGAQE